MPSARSYFNMALYRKHLTRNWPIWALYTIVWFFILPVYLLLNSSTVYGGAESAAVRFADRTVLGLLESFGIGIAVCYGLFSAMAIWSYLYNPRAAGLMHALPIRREGLFVTGFLAGATFSIVPNALIFLLTLGSETFSGTANPGVLVLWFAVQSMLCLFFFCFGTFCGFVTGHILVLPVFFFIFNFLAIGILTLIENVLHHFVYGFSGITAAWPVAEWLSPLYQITKTVNVSYPQVNGIITGVKLEGLSTMAVYTVIGLLLAALALLFYRRHQVEQAGEVVTAGWLRPVFKYGFAFCGALSFGSLLYEIFSTELRSSAWGMLGALLLCGFLAYLAAEMLLQKSLRVLGKGWKGCAVFLVVLMVLTAAMELDLSGYEKRVPDAAAVERVTLSNVNSAPYDSVMNDAIDAVDSELIARVVALHSSAVRGKAAVEQGIADFYDSNTRARTANETTLSAMNAVNFRLTYTLQNGREISRSYTIPVTAELLADPESPAALLLDILNHRANIADSYFPPDVTAADFINGAVSFCNVSDGRSYEEVRLSAAEAGRIYEAAMADLNSGGLGRRYLLEDRDYYTQVYQNEISLTVYGEFSGWMTAAADAEVPREIKPDSASVSFHLQEDSVNLIAALRELGILDDDHRLVTLLEERKAE